MRVTVFIGWIGYGYSMQCLIGLASSLGIAERCHNLPKEDGWWPACSHNRKLHISWKVHKEKFLGFVWAGEMFWFNSNQARGLFACCARYNSVNNRGVWKTGWGNARKIISSDLKVLIIFVWEWKEHGPITWEFVFLRLWVHKWMFYLYTFNVWLLLSSAPKSY